MSIENKSYEEVMKEEGERERAALQGAQDAYLASVEWSEDPAIRELQEKLFPLFAKIDFYKNREGREELRNAYIAMAAGVFSKAYVNNTPFDHDRKEEIMRAAYDHARRRGGFLAAYELARNGNFLTKDMVLELAEEAEAHGSKSGMSAAEAILEDYAKRE